MAGQTAYGVDVADEEHPPVAEPFGAPVASADPPAQVVRPAAVRRADRDVGAEHPAVLSRSSARVICASVAGWSSSVVATSGGCRTVVRT